VAVRPAAESERPVATVHIGRQPVHDRSGVLYGYELLFRAGADATTSGAPDLDGDSATTSTILAAFSQFGLDDLLCGRPGFINLTEAFLVGEIPVPFGPERAVLEVLETVELTDAVLAGARHLVHQGYRLALDDFVWTDRAADLLRLATIVKVDVLDQDWDRIEATVTACRPFRVRLLAERVEDDETYRRCRDLGFELYQGYHLGRPQTLSTETLTPGQALALRLVTSLGDPDTTAEDVEGMLRTDPALTYRLLRIANSTAFAQERRVSSVRDAVILVGLARLRAWLVLVQLSGLTQRPDVLTESLVLARTCELLAQNPDGTPPDTAFTLGLLHGIADTLRTTPEALTRKLPSLGEDLDRALRGEPGALRAVLDDVLTYQQLPFTPGELRTRDLQEVADAYLAALAWASATYRDTSH
jgi:EAL and modified HD-GYP domain-containing signal transduction protein